MVVIVILLPKWILWHFLGCKAHVVLLLDFMLLNVLRRDLMLLDTLMLDALSNDWALGKRCITLSVLTRLVPLTGCL